jgi:anti-sigma regulatory factor (Ser/Thr protein kinase)
MELAGALGGVSKSYPAVPASVPRARAALGAFAAGAGATPGQLADVRLLVSEAVTNVVQHAYDSMPGEVHLSATVAGEELWILIADDGRGLRVRRASQGLGLGLAWMARFSDELTLAERASGGLEVRLRFDLQRTAEPASQDSAPGIVSLC